MVRALHNIRESFGIRAVSLSGGEPFCREEFCEIYAEAHRLFDVTLISTGAGLTEAIRGLLASAPPAQAICSLYGLRRKHDAFSRRAGAFVDVIRYLEFLGELRKRCVTELGVNIVCHRDNVEEIPDMLRFLWEEDLADEVKLLALSPVGRGQEIETKCLSGDQWLGFMDELRSSQDIKKWRFRGGVRIERHVAREGEGQMAPLSDCFVIADSGEIVSSCVHIDSDGEIYPCTMLVRQKQFSMGNILRPQQIASDEYHEKVAGALALLRKCWNGGCDEDHLAGCLGYYLACGHDYRCDQKGILVGCPDRYELVVPGTNQ